MPAVSRILAATLPLLHLIFLLSGCAGLGYQLLWTRLFAIGVGHEMTSMLAVVGGFFAGLAAGSWLLDKPLARSPRPWLWMAGLEAAIGLWGLISVALIPWANQLILMAGGERPTGAGAVAGFLVPALVLLPATFCMGATLPAMERALARRIPGKWVGGLYAANTLGACLGTWLVVFHAAPLLGFRLSLVLLAGVNALCAAAFAVLAWRAPRVGGAGDEQNASHTPEVEKAGRRAATKLSGTRLKATLFITGFFGIGYEVVCVRALSQVLENTVYSYAALLAVYLLGTAVGAAAYQQAVRKPWGQIAAGYLLPALSASCLLGVACLPWTGSATRYAGEFGAALLVFFLPTFFMGALFSHLLQQAKDDGLGLGRPLALNTLGASLAPAVFGLVVLPAVGMRAALMLCALGYLGLLTQAKKLVAAAASCALPVMLLIFLPWTPVEREAGQTVVTEVNGAMAQVAVLRDPQGVRWLKVNNRYQMGSTARPATERRQALLPVLLHPHPTKALFLGLGPGITLGGAADVPDLEVDAVELLPEVLAVMPEFAPENRWPYTPRVRLVAADARRFVKASRDAYDVIVADLFHPSRDGAGTLYTREHFLAVRGRLTEGGVFCQWLPLYQMELPVLKIIVRTFQEVFPEPLLFLGNFNAQTPGLALVGRLRPTPAGDDWFERRTESDAFRNLLEREGYGSAHTVFAGLVAGSASLRSFAQGAVINTDDKPVVMYEAGKAGSDLESTAAQRLEELRQKLRAGASPQGEEGSARLFAGRLRNEMQSVWRARDLFLDGVLAEMAGRNEAARALYLKSAEVTPHFLVGYAVCLQRILDEAAIKPREMHALARRLAEVRPEIEDAKIVLRELFGDTATVTERAAGEAHSDP